MKSLGELSNKRGEKNELFDFLKGLLDPVIESSDLLNDIVFFTE